MCRQGQRHGRQGAGETHCPLGQAIDVRGFQVRMTIAAEVIPAQLIEHDEKDILGHSMDLSIASFLPVTS